MIYDTIKFIDVKVKFYKSSHNLELEIKNNEVKLVNCERDVKISNSRNVIEIQVDGDNFKVLVNEIEIYNDECAKFKAENMNENTIKQIEFTADIPDNACGKYNFISVK